MFAIGDEVRMRGAPCQRGKVVETRGAKIVVEYEDGLHYIDWNTHWEFDPEFFLIWG